MRNIFLINLGLILMAFIFDQLTKMSAGSFFTIVKNHGLFLNTLEDLPLTIKIVVLGTLSGIVFFFYLTLIYLINLKLKFLRYTLSILMAGILSNTFDKITFGYTVDFIPFGRYAFNVADIMTLGGTALLVIYLSKHHREIWPVADGRRTILINPKAQVMFGLKYTIVALCTSFILGLLSMTYIKNYILPSVLTSGQNIVPTYLVLHVTLTVLFSSFVFVMGIIVSHRFVGPIVALERFVDNLQRGNTSPLTLRQGDYFKQLEELGRKISDIKKNSDLE